MQIMSLVAPTPPPDDGRPRSETDVASETGESDFMAILAGALDALGQRDISEAEEEPGQTADGEVAAVLVEGEGEGAGGEGGPADVPVTEVPTEVPTELAAQASASEGEVAGGESVEVAPAPEGEVAGGESVEVAPAPEGEVAGGESVEVAPAPEGEVAGGESEEVAPAPEGEVAGGESVEVAPAPEGAAPTSDGEVADGETAVLDAGAQPSTSEPASEFADDAMDAPAPATATGSEDAEAEITDADSTEAEATASAELDGEPAPAAPSPTHVAGADADADADVGGRPDTAARSAVRATADTAAPSAPTAEPDAPAPSKAPTTVADAMFDADLESLEGDDPWQQVARVVRPLRQLADGSQRIALQLRPAELGSVHLEVALEDGGLNMRAVTETVAARDALVGALPELRAELARSGIGVGSLEVGEDTMAGDAAGNGPGGDETAGRDTRARTATDGLGGASPAATSVPVPQPTPVVAAGRLDLTL